MLRDIVLHGELRERFNGPFRFDADTAADAVRALCAQVPGFRRAIAEGSYRVIRGSGPGIDLHPEALQMRLGRCPELHFVPVVAGEGRGIGKAIAGIALIAAAFLLPQALPALFPATGTIAGFGYAGSVLAMGASITLSGIASLLAPSATQQGGQNDPRNSFLFNGQLNVDTQGGPVPLCFGEFLVGSVVVSAGLTSDQLMSTGGFGTAVVGGQLGGGR